MHTERTGDYQKEREKKQKVKENACQEAVDLKLALSGLSGDAEGQVRKVETSDLHPETLPIEVRNYIGNLVDIKSGWRLHACGGERKTVKVLGFAGLRVATPLTSPRSSGLVCPPTRAGISPSPQ